MPLLPGDPPEGDWSTVEDDEPPFPEDTGVGVTVGPGVGDGPGVAVVTAARSKFDGVMQPLTFSAQAHV